LLLFVRLNKYQIFINIDIFYSLFSNQIYFGFLFFVRSDLLGGRVLLLLRFEVVFTEVVDGRLFKLEEEVRAAVVIDVLDDNVGDEAIKIV